MRSRHVFQTLLIETDVESGEHVTRPNDKREIIGNEVVPTAERPCVDWNVPNAVSTPKRQQMLLVQMQNTTDVGTSLASRQPGEGPADRALEGGRKGLEMNSWQMPACANL